MNAAQARRNLNYRINNDLEDVFRMIEDGIGRMEDSIEVHYDSRRITRVEIEYLKSLGYRIHKDDFYKLTHINW